MGIPRFRITNGPVGVGMGDGTPSPPATSLPMTIGLAAGFDPDLAHAYGDIIGSETATLGQHVLEGPGVCLHRTTIAGRNFEYFSEDPYLSGVMGVAVTKAIQAHDVIAMAKHYVVNDQEYERFRASVEVDEHVLRELYLLPFEMLVKDAEIAAIMSAYNRVRGVYATEYRLHADRHPAYGVGLRRLRPVRLLVVPLLLPRRSTPAWTTRCRTPSGSTRRTSRPPSRTPASRSRPSTVPWSAATPRCSGSGSSSARTHPGEIDAQAHGAVSRTIGSQIAVLLKNDGGLLPLDADAGSIVIIGQSEFVDDACLGGGGSSKVTPLYTVPPLDGMQDVLRDLGSSATVTKVTVADDLSNLDEAKNAAGEADVVVLMAGLVATEGADQPDANMLNDQNRMLDELLGINPTTVVVLKDSNPVLMPWIDKAPAVLEAWNQGAEDGHVVADLLFGVVNPSGKVPTSYPRSEDDTLYAGRPERYPGTDEGDGYPVIRYSEGLGDRVPLVPGARHRAAVRLRVRPVLHHVRHRRRVGGRAGRRERAGHRDRVGDQHRPGGRRRGGAGVSRDARGGTAPQATRRVPEGVPGAGRVEAGDDHHRPGGDEPPVRRLGLLHPGLRDQAGDYTVYVGNSADNTPHTATLTVG